MIIDGLYPKKADGPDSFNTVKKLMVLIRLKFIFLDHFNLHDISMASHVSFIEVCRLKANLINL